MTDKSYEFAVKKAQLEQLLSANVRTAIVNAVLASLLAYVLFDLQPTLILAWLLLIVPISLIRFFIGHYYSKHPVLTEGSVHHRIVIMRIGVFISASLWGMVNFVFFFSPHSQHFMLVIFMLAGMSAGAVVVYSIDKLSAYSYTFFTILPMVLIFAFSGNREFHFMSFTGFVYITFMYLSIKGFNQKLLDNIKFQLEAKTHSEEIEQLAFFDPLTGLPNRRLFFDRLKQSLLTSKRLDKSGALMFLDLDNFKKLNDSNGHNVGDLLLQQVAQRLLESVRKSDTVARIGGDEFVVLVENLSTDEQSRLKETEKIIQLVVANLNQPFLLNDHSYACKISIGIAFYGKDGEHEDDLIKHADIAMYQAKKSKKHTYQFYDHHMLEQMQ